MKHDTDGTADDPASDHMASSRDVRTGYLSGPGFTDALVRYSVVDGLAIYNGCIDMGPVEEVEGHADAVRSALAVQAATALASPGPAPGDTAAPAAAHSVDLELMGIGLPENSSFLWTNGVMPFVIDAGLPNTARVTQAIAHIEANSPIRFVARTNQSNYVRFIRNPNVGWSSSPVGMRGGEQLIRLSDGANMGVVVHEICHSLGILHEQSRCDRDSFVTINYGNIQDGFESNFDKFCDGFVDYYEYDYGSIMHYGPTAFGINGATTIVPLQSGVTIGQRNGLSFGDRQTIARMYQRFFGAGHTGVWRTKSGVYGLWVNATWDSFKAKWEQWAAQGLRLVDINVRQVGNQLRYSGVWLAGTGAYGLWANATWDSFKAKWQEWSNQGLRLADLHVRRAGNEYRYSGVFVPGTGGHALWANASWSSFKAKWEEWAAQGLRLVDINVIRVGNDTRYSGVWLPGTGGHGLWANATWSSFVEKWRAWAAQGLRLVDVNVHQSGNEYRYSGVFLPGTDGYYLWANVSWESFRAKWEQLAAQGLRLVDYEFIEPAAASDAPTLDVAGVPVTANGHAPSRPEDLGGAYTDDGSSVEPVSATAAEAPVRAEDEDGFGAIVMPTSAATTSVAADDGVGGVVTTAATPTATAASTASDADGMGGLFGMDEAAQAEATEEALGGIRQPVAVAAGSNDHC